MSHTVDYPYWRLTYVF